VLLLGPYGFAFNTDEFATAIGLAPPGLRGLRAGSNGYGPAGIVVGGGESVKIEMKFDIELPRGIAS
jgi:hypothetical protein